MLLTAAVVLMRIVFFRRILFYSFYRDSAFIGGLEWVYSKVYSTVVDLFYDEAALERGGMNESGTKGSRNSPTLIRLHNCLERRIIIRCYHTFL